MVASAAEKIQVYLLFYDFFSLIHNYYLCIHINYKYSTSDHKRLSLVRRFMV